MPDQGVPVLHSSNSSFVIQTIAGGGGGGSFSLGASNLGNTLGQTGVTGSRIVLAGIGNLTLSQLTDANGGTISISGGTAGAGFSAGVSGGNTAGQTGATGTRLVLAGGQSITLSQATDANGGTVTISGASQVPQSVQTQNRFNLTLDGNTAGALAQVSSGTLTLAGGNGITLSQAGNAITISGSNFTQSVQPETQTFIGGVSASNTLYTSGTVRFTGVGGGVTVSSNTGQRVDISVAAPVAQTEQTQSRFNLTISGNTAGAGALISSGVLTLAGGNNITVSQAGNALTISGPNVGGAQTGISGLANSETTYTSGSVTLSALGAITIRSTTGQHFQLSVNSQSVQPETQTFIGGISASDTLYTSGTVRFTGVGGGITVSTNTGQRVDLSVAAPVAQTNQAGSLFAVGNTTSSTSGTYDARTLSLRGDGIISVAATNSGFRISASQSVQPGVQHLVVSNTTFSSGTVSLSGFGDVTVNTAANIIRISAPVQTAQTGISGIANSQTTYTSGTVSLSELGAITIRSTTGNQFQFSVNSQTVQTQNLHNVTLSGNTAGVMAQISSGTMTLAGGTNITLSQNGNAVTIIGPSVSAGSDTDVTEITMTGHGLSVGDWVRMDGTDYVLAQADSEVNAEVVGVVSAVAGVDDFTLITGGLVTGLSGLTSGAVHWLDPAVAGAITDTEPTGNGEIAKPVLIARNTTSGYVYNMRGNIVSTAALTAFLAGLSNVGNTVGDTGITGSRLVLAGGNNITLSQSTNASGGTVTISAFTQSVQPGVQQIVASNASFSSGTVSISGFGDVTVNTAAGIIRISAPVQTVESQSIGMSNLGNTSGTTGIASGGQVRFLFAGGNNITLSQSINGASGTITISAPNAIAETQTGISGIANSQTTYTSGTVSLSELGAITIRSTTGNQFQLSVNAQTVESQSIGMSNVGNTSGTTGMASGGQVRFVFAGGNNITLSQSLNGASGTITISAPNLGAGAMSAGVSNLGNTAGSTGVTGTRLVLVGTNNISLSQSTDANGGTVSFNNTVSAFLAGVSTGGNTAGDTGVTGTRLVLVGSDPMSLSQATGANGATVSIRGPALSSLSATGAVSISTNGSTISIGAPVLATLADWQNMPHGEAQLMSNLGGFSKVPIYFNINLPGMLDINSIAFKVSQVTGNTLQSFSVHFGIYSAVNSTSMSRMGSFSEAYVVSSASSASFTGIRNYVMTGVGTHGTLSLLIGGDYGVGMMFSAAATQSMNMSLMGAMTTAAMGMILPGTNQLSAGTSQGAMALWGRGSTTVNALPANVVASELVNQGSGASAQLVPWIYMRS